MKRISAARHVLAMRSVAHPYYWFIVWIGLGAASLTATATPTERTPIATPSELNAAAASYDGKEVIIRGYLVLGPGSRVIYESRELHAEMQQAWHSRSKTFDPTIYDKYCLAA